eukprot:m.104967 g.104967  ORF g.104967 m.104967 type:complete len:236 (-) comp22468_c0_seq11:56-763(-)
MRLLLIFAVALLAFVEVVSPAPHEDKCLNCLDFAANLTKFEKHLADLAVEKTCNATCALLANLTHEPSLKGICTILCDGVGFVLFNKTIQSLSSDPFNFCITLLQCPYADDSDARFVAQYVTPTQGEIGTTFNFTFTFETNGTGAGQTNFSVYTLDHIPQGEIFYHPPLDAGTYNVTWSLHAQTSSHCDPVLGPCEQWSPGNYSVGAEFWYGEAGAKKPHTSLLSSTKVYFEMVR